MCTGSVRVLTHSLRCAVGRAADLSGFLGQVVGFVVGFLGLPDTHLIRIINELEANCRVCRVFLGVESSGEFRADKKHQQPP